MNNNSGKAAMICVSLLIVIVLVVGLIMTAEQFEWIETNWFGGESKKGRYISYSLIQTSDSTYAFNAMIVKDGDSKIYGRKSFEYKSNDYDSTAEAWIEMQRWAYEICDYEYVYMKTNEEKQ